MAPKHVTLHSSTVAEAKQYGEVLTTSSIVPAQPKEIAPVIETEEEQEEEEDYLGLELAYVTQEKRPKAEDKVEKSVPKRSMFEFSSDHVAMDREDDSYPDDTDYPNDMEEYNSWKERQRLRGEA